ncbi:MAG TPA: class I SAM-dependent methyltransferase [Nitrospirales bacterium]|jgi:ubiquinone/menaquinone biosynthesis C-methylase UbiE
MGFYSRVILPWFLDRALDREALNRIRQNVLSEANGEVLEIGFGTGVNLPYYPSGVKKITAVDPNPGMSLRAHKRIKASPLPIDLRISTAETLPIPDNSFDTVVSTLTLCSIPDPDRAMGEVYRVLKPGGRFLFFEHGLSPDRKVQAWQDRLTPVSKILGGGCHLNRDIRSLVAAQPFVIQNLANFYLEDAPKMAGYMSQGIAQKPL